MFFLGFGVVDYGRSEPRINIFDLFCGAPLYKKGFIHFIVVMVTQLLWDKFVEYLKLDRIGEITQLGKFLKLRNHIFNVRNFKIILRINIRKLKRDMLELMNKTS